MRILTVPPGNVPARDRPDPSILPTTQIAAGTQVVENERIGVWSRVLTPDGRDLWVDGRRLLPSEADTGEEAEVSHPPTGQGAVPTTAPGSSSPSADTASAATVAPASEADTTEWVYVLDPVEVRGLHDTAAVVGTLQPGAWYALVRVNGEWARVVDTDGSLEGWVLAAHVHRQTDPPPIEGGPSTVEEPTWTADHAVPAEGLRAWATPDPAGDVVAKLAAGVELQVIERRADWANVRAENGWEAWVDGRRLIPILASGTASPATPVPASGDSTLNNVGARALAIARSNPVSLIAAIALLASVFLPWFGGGAPWSFDLPAGFLWSFSSDTGWFSIGLVMLIVGAVALASVFVDQIAPYRRIVGGVAAAIAALWLIQTFRALLDFTDSGFAGIVADVFTDYFALGPWVALAAGVALLARR